MLGPAALFFTLACAQAAAAKAVIKLPGERPLQEPSESQQGSKHNSSRFSKVRVLCDTYAHFGLSRSLLARPLDFLALPRFPFWREGCHFWHYLGNCLGPGRRHGRLLRPGRNAKLEIAIHFCESVDIFEAEIRIGSVGQGFQVELGQDRRRDDIPKMRKNDGKSMVLGKER